jgi:hypothetical protein
VKLENPAHVPVNELKSKLVLPPYWLKVQVYAPPLNANEGARLDELAPNVLAKLIVTAEVPALVTFIRPVPVINGITLSVTLLKKSTAVPLPLHVIAPLLPNAIVRDVLVLALTNLAVVNVNPFKSNVPLSPIVRVLVVPLKTSPESCTVAPATGLIFIGKSTVSPLVLIVAVPDVGANVVALFPLLQENEALFERVNDPVSVRTVLDSVPGNVLGIVKLLILPVTANVYAVVAVPITEIFGPTVKVVPADIVLEELLIFPTINPPAPVKVIAAAEELLVKQVPVLVIVMLLLFIANVALPPPPDCENVIA